MNVFLKNGIKIDYSVRRDRFSLAQKNEWLSITPSVFALLVTTARYEIESNRVEVYNNGTCIEITNVLGNIKITNGTPGIATSVVIDAPTMRCLVMKFEEIIDLAVNCRKKLLQSIPHLDKGRNDSSENATL